MNANRCADILIRHHFVDYIYTISYSEEFDSFEPVLVRFANPKRKNEPKNGDVLFRRILKEPTLRANLLEALLPEKKGSITALREKAIYERGDSLGVYIGSIPVTIVLCVAYNSGSLIPKNWDSYEISLILAPLTVITACMEIPIRPRIRRWYLGRHCRRHGHRFSDTEVDGKRLYTSCDRCGYTIWPDTTQQNK